MQQKEAAIWEQRLDDATEKGIQIGKEKGRVRAGKKASKSDMKKTAEEKMKNRLK